MSQQLPVNWPSDIEYLRQPTLSSAVSAPALKLLNTPTLATASHQRLALSSIPFPNPHVRITPVHDPSHPANGQAGLFAIDHLLPNTFILPYIGHLHTNHPQDTDASSSYDISLDRELGLALDAAKAGNEARFVNDYRGNADKPNAEFRDCWVQTADKKWERWIGIFVLSAGKAGKRKQGIRPGQEILVSYGKAFWTERKTEAGHQQA